MVTIGYALQSFTNLAALSAADANDYFRLGAVLNCLGAFIAAGTLMRLAFQGDPAEPRFRIGPAGFQLGRMELRLLVATLGCLVVVLCYVLLIAALSAAVVAGAASIRDVSNDLNSVSDAVRIFTAPGAIVAAASFAVAGAGLVVVMTRLVLVAPATADSAEIRLLSTWRYTPGGVLADIPVQPRRPNRSLGHVRLGGGVPRDSGRTPLLGKHAGPELGRQRHLRTNSGLRVPANGRRAAGLLL